MRSRQLASLLCFLLIAAVTLVYLKGSSVPRLQPSSSSPSSNEKPLPSTAHSGETNPAPTTDVHPIHHLITQAEDEFGQIKARQSKTLQEAVAEYRRRYKIPPPPNFDKWYNLAKKKKVQLIDEYDTIYHSLLPFWALKPETIRERARESIGFDNAMLALMIRNGKHTKVTGGAEWQQEATIGMIKDFVRYLPDMDLAFNVHDEPRVLVAHDDLSRLVAMAKDIAMPAAFANEAPLNKFSPRPSDLNDGRRTKEYKTTRFNRFAHQPTWTESRISCSPDSPARAIDETTPDNTTAYALGELGFVYNATAFSDVCLSPSMQSSFGFFDRPNAFDVTHDLFPVFSQSKISSFQDIVYPSPWYWAERARYDGEKDMEWDQKQSKMYWRGSTTGGFSRDGGWRRQHRQRFVQKVNGLDQTQLLSHSPEGSSSWQVQGVSRNDYRDLFDVKFTYIGQCDPGDCDAQREYFEVVENVDFQEAWAYRYLLDIDGNAFSGRFYAFLHSKSLVYKMAVFREWHEEWLKPWVHYVPLGMKGTEYLESVRYFAREQAGQIEGPRLANAGREWAAKALRNQDFEVWFFRLLLE